MKCLRCENSELEERERDGVVIDVCPQCRGIWLDRGELETLIARSPDDASGLAQRRHGDDEPPSSDGPGRHRKKRSWFDIFD